MIKYLYHCVKMYRFAKAYRRKSNDKGLREYYFNSKQAESSICSDILKKIMWPEK